ncbi:MAG TPA: TM0106 family RecB-like putative nuclease, partial [Cyclobacteriaceae bacterium]|nr:TM0106 family RecB-like putative nuclease [Cyclobacteriaceae bacterium]
TKLAQNTKAATILQLCLYCDLLAKLQGKEPEKMYVIKPGEDFQTETYRYTEFSAYYRLVKKKLEQIIDSGEQNTYPDPVEHCNICRWWQVCDKRQHDDDHLSLVAGIRSLHIVELEKQKITTLEQFAKTEKLEKPERGNKETFERKHQQAKVQLEGRNQKIYLSKLLPIEAGRGFNRLPQPNLGDIYFDIEGDAYYDTGGLEYMLGYSYYEKGELVYQRLWATNRLEEKKSFYEFMKFLTERWKRFPDMYVYHFAPYEPAAIKRLSRVHAIFEKEVDDFLRAERFIDLHSVFKEALLASVESYSLKELEKFTNYTRKVLLHDASVARKAVEVALELNDFKSLPDETIKTVEGYNEDDCLATEALHRWLERQRAGVIQSGKNLQRPEIKTGEASENVQQLDTRSQALFNALTGDLPEDRTTWSDEQKAKWLLAHQIDYFRREDKSAWWEFYRVHELEHEELLDERKAITGLQFAAELPKQARQRNPTHRYIFPEQETSIDVGDDVIEVKGDKIGTVIAISVEQNTVDIRKTAKAVDIHPLAVHVSERVDPGSLATALMDLAQQVDEFGLTHTWPYPASKDLLMKRKPKLLDGEGAFLQQGEEVLDAAIRIALNLDSSVLAIQGPPGAGKTYTGAMMILALSKAGKKIGITAVGHKVIRNLTEEAIAIAKRINQRISFVHKVSSFSDQLPDEITEVDKGNEARDALNAGKVICGTAWLWAENDSREILDYLFVDEAGQMSLSQALAASRAAKNIILLGDPQQLEQPQKGAHPEGSDVAALTYLLDGHATMPDGKGLFLDKTRRLHPKICEFTSQLFYEGRLKPFAGTDKQLISGDTPFDGAGLFYVPVNHKGNQFRSIEEINVVEKIVFQLLASSKWTNKEGVTAPLSKDDILIVAPYNAQVSALTEKLPGMRVGTVDKFQGQEAPVVIYSMAASTIEDAPRGISFLFNPNRLNVATSRAKSVCILVVSPKLFDANCITIEQLRWINSFSMFQELSKKIETK